MGILRFVLALTVVAHHSGSIFGLCGVHGVLAVQGFYIISGFWISMILNEKYIGANSSYRLYISNRFLRLWPIYVTILLCTICVRPPLFSLLFSQIPELSLKTNIYLKFTNVFMIGQDFCYFFTREFSTGLTVFTSEFLNAPVKFPDYIVVPLAWTLGVEFWFYFVAPFILRRGLLLPAILIVLSISVRYWTYSLGWNIDPWSYRFFPSELCLFLSGRFSYEIFRKLKSLPPWPLLKRFSVLIFIGLLVYLLNYDSIDPWITFPISNWPFDGQYFHFIMIFAIPFVALATKDWRLDWWMGKMSYPIYLVHFLTIYVATRFIGEDFLKHGGGRNALLAIIFAVPLVGIDAFVNRFRQSRLA